MRSNAGIASGHGGLRFAHRQLQVGEDVSFILWGTNGNCRVSLGIV